MAMTAGVIDSVSGFIVQIAIFLVLFFSSDLDLGLSLDLSDTSGAATVVLIALVVIVVAVVLVLAIAPAAAAGHRRLPPRRRPPSGCCARPRKLLQLFLGNLVSQVLFAVAFGACRAWPSTWTCRSRSCC